MNKKDKLVVFLEEYLQEVKNIKVVDLGKSIGYRRNKTKLRRLRLLANELGISFEKNDYEVKQ